MDAGRRLCAFSADLHRYSAKIEALLLLDLSPMAATPQEQLHQPAVSLPGTVSAAHRFDPRSASSRTGNAAPDLSGRNPASERRRFRFAYCLCLLVPMVVERDPTNGRANCAQNSRHCLPLPIIAQSRANQREFAQKSPRPGPQLELLRR
jgi:hypothetical protein